MSTDANGTGQAMTQELDVYTSDDAPRAHQPVSQWQMPGNLLLVNITQLDELGANFARRRDGCLRTYQAHKNKPGPGPTLFDSVAAEIAKAHADTWESARAEVAALVIKLSGPDSREGQNHPSRDKDEDG